jgi:hypothetical protein
MTVQRLHPQLAAVDILTAKELNECMAHNFDLEQRDRYRGVKLLDLPIVTITAAGTTTTIAHTPPGQQLGPEEGFIWRIGRITVSSSGVDTGAVTLYRGSDPTQLDPRHQVDNTLKIGQAYYPGSRGLYLKGSTFLYLSATTVAANTYVVTGQVVEVPAEMMGKIL